MEGASTRERERSRAVAEQARETTWRGQSFLRELFMGRFRFHLIYPAPIDDAQRREFRAFYDALRSFLADHVDPVAIDESGEYPPEVIAGLAELGAFGMKIPKRYGGLGLSHPEYVQAMQLVGSYDANLTALLSAHQAIGVPQPVLLFGTEEQKQKWLPRCARGAISAFALTEPAVGSDPGKLETSAERLPDGSYVLDGAKLWCTNGTLAELLVVMARDSELGGINAFVVDTATPGVRIEGRCHFMGLRALANAVVRLDNVRVPAENLIGKRGQGLKIALTTLNTGRLTLPAATAGQVKHCLEILRKWGAARRQWGAAIGEHEAVAHKIADAASAAFAMDALSLLVGDMADRRDYDIRLEAAAAKEYNTTLGYRVIDDTLQVRGGRGFETEHSLASRGEVPIGVERMLRDARINMIFEGSSEIMHLFMAREALDEHVSRAGTVADPRAPRGQRLRALAKAALFYAGWYPLLWLRELALPRFADFGELAKHLRYARRATLRLARRLFHLMLRHGLGLERRQAQLFRAVDIAMEVFALSAAVARAATLREIGDRRAGGAILLTDRFGYRARRRIERLFDEMRHNDDAERYAVARRVLAGDLRAFERGAMPLPYHESELRPPSMAELTQRRPAPEPRPEASLRAR